jgi:hypothetical protein
MASRHCFAAVFAERQRRDGGGMSEHLVRALTWTMLAIQLGKYVGMGTLTRVGIEEPDILVFMPTDYDAL